MSVIYTILWFFIGVYQNSAVVPNTYFAFSPSMQPTRFLLCPINFIHLMLMVHTYTYIGNNEPQNTKKNISDILFLMLISIGIHFTDY